MLFDDWFVSAKGLTQTVTEPFLISKVERTADNKTELTFPADEGCTYTVQYSSDLKNWTDSPNSTLTATVSDPVAKQIAETPNNGEKLYYRILRTVGD